MFQTIMEPVRSHSVAPSHPTTREQRIARLEAAGYNLFRLAPEDVAIDLVTDAGTGDEGDACLRSTEYLGEALYRMGVPIVRPIGGHAVFIDARELLPHVPALESPGQALAVALYREGGIRAGEIGGDLVRLAVPRGAHPQARVEYLIDVVAHVADQAVSPRSS